MLLVTGTSGNSYIRKPATITGAHDHVSFLLSIGQYYILCGKWLSSSHRDGTGALLLGYGTRLYGTLQYLLLA